MNYNDITMERHCVNSVQTTAMAAVKRFLCLFLFLIAFVSNVLAATVTETYSVESSTTVPTAGEKISHSDNVSVQYGSETNSVDTNGDLEWGIRTFNEVTYIRRLNGPKKAAVVDGSVSGYFFAITPTKSGTLSVTVYMNSSNRTICCSTVENSSFNNLSTITVESAGQYVFSDISVEANKTYYVYTTGTGELHFGGYTFTPSDSTDDSGDDDDDSSSTETPEGTKNTLKIDFDNNTKYSPSESGYEAWSINDLEPSGSTLPSDTKTFSSTGGDVTIKIQAVQDTIKIKKISYAQALQSGLDKLINDGITGEGFKDNENYNLSSGRMAIKFTITGLSKGQHSIQAFHNNVELGAGSTAPDIFVDVDSVNVLGNIAQTYREQDRSLCAKSYITFDVASSDAETEILYYTLAESDETYTRNNFCINSLEIDASDIDDFAQKPYPANLDWHVETPNNSVTLSWATAVNGADNHVIYFGTDEDAVKNGTAEKAEQTENTLTKTGLSPLKRYYWRVDEVKDGTTTEGYVWSFQPRRLAFPGADGAGKYAVGGRGYNGNGVVYHVKSLDDDVDNPTEGTLRYGVEKLTGPRTIVFDVAGVIKLSDRLNASDSYITVAGQTAPGIGVLLRDNTYGANGPDNITRFMNFRYGHGDDWDGTSANQNVGGSAGMAGADNAIMDHCTMAWGNDEVFSSRNANDMTLQNCLIGESLNQNGHKNYWDGDSTCQHGYAASIGGSVGSFHHNLLAHNAGRNWSMAGGLLGEAYAGELSIYNNVVYNWYNRTTDGGAHNVNFVNNYYKKGAATDDSKLMLSAQLEGAGTGTQEYYVKGNILELTDGSKIEDKEGTTYTWENKGQNATWDVFVDEPYEFWSMETNVETAEAAFKNVLCDVGANFAGQDSNSKRLIQETKDGSYSKEGGRSGMKGLIDKESDSEGWETIQGEFGTHTRPSDWDSDGDGIPAWFETAMGWSDSSLNNNEDRDGDYYTDLEEYLNWMAVPHFYNMDGDGNVSAFKNGTITLSDYFAGYTSPTYTVADDGGLTVSISDDGTLTYSATQPLASPLVTVKVTATESGISLTREFNIYVEVDVEEKEYSLSQETYSYSNKTTTWYFENGFTVTNNSKAYSAANDNTIKYSRNVEYTINIPDGMSVNAIKFYGYTNVNNTNDDYADGYLASLNGTSYSNSTYTFPSRSTSTTKEHTITFSESVTGKITFKMASNECALAITLYATGGTEVETDLAPAFPGAEGHGRYAQGGRGTGGFTNVYHVTSLADDKDVKGTLRWALAQDAPRTIVFDVSGYIDLTDDLQIPSYTTIAGQTAPEPGITLRYYTVNTNNSKNVIIRYMRFRRSQVKDVDDGADAAYGKNGKNIILDHCSFSWSIDEVASFYDNRNFTMQWCVLGEGLCNSGHTKGGHSYGGIWGGKNASFHHNMITNVQNRAPRLCGARYNWDGYDKSKYSNSVQAEQVDVRNNLYYNWGNGNGAYGGMGGYHNLVNNYYKAGPGTKNTTRVFEGGVVGNEDSQYGLPADLPGRFYINGNYVTAAEGQEENYDWNGFIQKTVESEVTYDLTYTDSQGWYGTAGETVNIVLTEENEAGEVTTHTAEEAYEKVRTYGGASLYRDDVDKRYMEDAADADAEGTTSYKMTQTKDGKGETVTEFTEGIVDLINDPEAEADENLPSFPMLAVVERPSDWDTDSDGIPDAWEDANGLDKNNSADGNAYTLDATKQWYTNLEVYLNSIVEDITKAQNNNSTGTTIEIEDEYYPTWTEPDVTEFEEFVLSDSTHASGTANEWSFSNRFVITGQSGTYESTGNYIKYSDGYEYTITVPSNVTVSRVKIEGYSNSTVGEDKAYLATLGTLTFDDTKYVFPNSNASVNTASYEFSLPETVTGGTIAIKATGAQACLIVTLYGTKEGVTLDELKNMVTTTLENVEETGTIKWVMSSGTITEEAVYTDINSAGFSSDNISLGTNVTCTGTMTASSYTETKFKTTQSLEETEENAIDFTVTLRDGYTFVPEKVEFVASRGGTDAGTLSVKFYDGKEYTDLDDFKPGRYNRDEAFTHKSYEVSKGELSGTFGMRFFIKNVGGREYGLCNIIIHGTLKYESSKTTVTLDEMATVHDLKAAENVTVEMKRGLTAEMWNTFCVPFSLTKEQLQDALNDTGVEIVEYTRQEGSTLYFEDTEEIVAGNPYLIRPSEAFTTVKYDANTPTITFNGVNLVGATARSNDYSVAESVQPTGADFAFVGTYVRYIMETDGTELGLNTKNKLAKPAASPNNVMRGLRGFFRYDAGNGAGAKVVINGELTSIDEIDADNITGAKGVYHISGHFVRKDWNNGDGLQRGVYIVNGKKMVKY